MLKKIGLLTVLFCAGTLLADAVAVARSRDGYPLVVPQVRKLAPGSGAFILPEKLTVAAPDDLELAPLAKVYQIGRAGSDAVCRFELVSDRVPKSPEGYTLAITESGITVRARDIRGLYYGMQTLGMMLRHCADAKELKCCLVTDWPDLPMRGVYLQLDGVKRKEVDRICHVIDTFGALKYNTLLLGFSDNFPFSEYPFTLREEHLSRADAEKILAAAKRNHIEVIPKIQLVSHAAWLCDLPDHAKLLEGKATRKSTTVYCLSNPEIQPIVEKMIREIADLVKPRYFHIGLDEIYECGFPQCPKCKAADHEKLLLDHLRPVWKILADRNITPIVYQDQFFGFGELSGKKHDAIAKLPEKLGGKVEIMSWEYGSHPDATLARAIRERGFRDIWYMSFGIDIENAENLPKLAAKVGAKGNILAYWSCVPMTLTGHDDRRTVFYASTVAQANYSWNASDVVFSRIPVDSAQVLRELLDGQPDWAFRGAPTQLPLARAFNRALDDTRLFPAFDAATLRKIERIAASDKAKFKLETANGKALAIVLSGTPDDGFAVNPVKIPVETKATGASFLVTAAIFNTFGIVNDGHSIPVGEIKIVYADGRSAVTPLNLRQNLNDWNSYFGGNACRAVVRGNDRNGALFSLYAIDWFNPRPDVEIKEFVISSKPDSGIAPVIFAISLSDAEKAPVANTAAELPATGRRPNPKYETVVDFADGLPNNSRLYGDKMRGFRFAFVRDPKRGKVLELRIPAGAPVFSRAIVDLPIKNPREFGSVVFEIQVSDSKLLYRPDFYVMDRKASKVLGALGYFKEMDDQWHVVCIPRRNIIPKEGGGIDPRKAETMRFGFFVQDTKKPLNIRIGRIRFCDRVIPCRANVTTPAK